MGKRILILIPKLYHGGGAERSTKILGTLLSRNHSVLMVTQHAGDALETPGCETLCLNQPEHAWSKFWGIFVTAYQLKKICNEHNIDIVIGKMVRANVITIFSKVFFGNKTKNILMTHNAKTGRLVHRLLLPLYNLADDNVTVSHGAEEVLRSRGIKKVRTLNNAFDFGGMQKKYDEVLPQEHEVHFQNDITFFTVGRLHRQKGYPFLLRAFTKVVDQKKAGGKKVKLIIAGEGSERVSIENLIQDLNLSDHVVLLGNTKNIFPYLKRADAFVLTSLWEGLPTVVIEALFTKTPIIVTDCLSGPREILTDYSYSDTVSYPVNTDLATLIITPDKSYEQFEAQFVKAAVEISKKTQRQPEPITKYSASHIQELWNRYLDNF